MARRWSTRKRALSGGIPLATRPKVAAGAVAAAVAAALSIWPVLALPAAGFADRGAATEVAQGREPETHVGGMPDAERLVRDNTTFAAALYQRLAGGEGNLFFSPFSISAALAMAYAGARGETETQMARTLSFSLDREKIHPAFARLRSRLAEVARPDSVTLEVANSLWPRAGYPLLGSYTDLMKQHYGAEIVPLDYERNPDGGAETINEWVADNTRGKIQNLIPLGQLDALTALVLVNAAYFKGAWAARFDSAATRDTPFHVSPRETVRAPMMTRTWSVPYADLDSLQAIEIPYAGRSLSMIVLLPREPYGLDRLEADLSLANLTRWRHALASEKVKVFLPRFKMTSTFRLDDNLKAMGMVDAFRPERANFTGISALRGWLWIDAVIHKAFVEVNEAGTEAAAATAVTMKMVSIETERPGEPPVFRADHPFIYLIQENRTQAILFMGRTSDPTKQQ